MARVLCAGHVNWDVTFRVDSLPSPDGEVRIQSQRQSGGGSAANTAAALAGLELSVGLLGSVGDDAYGRLVRERLAQSGVDLSGLVTLTDAATAVKFLIVDQDGAVMVLGTDGANEAIGPDDIDDSVVAGVDHVHLTSQRPETAAAMAKMAASADVSVSVDPGRRPAERDFSAAIDEADLVFVNQHEHAAYAQALRDADDDRLVVVKRGEDGAEVRHAGTTFDHPGFAVDVVDTTGAGDAFNAGFLAVYLTEADLVEAVAVANACGALVAQSTGAQVPLTRQTVDDFIATYSE